MFARAVADVVGRGAGLEAGEVAHRRARERDQVVGAVPGDHEHVRPDVGEVGGDDPDRLRGRADRVVDLADERAALVEEHRDPVRGDRIVVGLQRHDQVGEGAAGPVDRGDRPVGAAEVGGREAVLELAPSLVVEDVHAGLAAVVGGGQVEEAVPVEVGGGQLERGAVHRDPPGHVVIVAAVRLQPEDRDVPAAVLGDGQLVRAGAVEVAVGDAAGVAQAVEVLLEREGPLAGAHQEADRAAAGIGDGEALHARLIEVADDDVPARRRGRGASIPWP